TNQYLCGSVQTRL
ncbi:phosphonoacetaldehyde hydrolase, partial [Vibrio parahaemolyticus V-223/04]